MTKKFRGIISEAVNGDVHNEVAKRGYERLTAAAGSVGSYKGNVRVYYRHKGGSLERTMVGDHDHHSYAAPSRYTGPGHYFASHYSPGPGYNQTYVHVKLPRTADLSDRDALRTEIEKQNPHTVGTGHSSGLADDIVKYHGS